MVNSSKILIINPFGIGDVLFATPLIQNLKAHFPQAKIGFLCNARSKAVLKDNPSIDYLFIYERDEYEAVKRRSKLTWIRKYLKFIDSIRKKRFDLAFDLSLNSQFGFLCWFAGIKKRIGYDYKKRGRFLTEKIKFSGYDRKHVVEYYLDLLKIIGCNISFRQIKLVLNDKKPDSVDSFFRKNNIVSKQRLIAIAACGGASWGKQAVFKHWPKEKFVSLADRLADIYKVKILLAGSKNESEVIDYISSNMRHKPIKAIGLPLPDFFRVLKEAELLIANDGGLLHMAVALGVKTVSLFGPVNEEIYGPYPKDDKRHKVVKKDLSCRPCYKKFRFSECHYDIKCLKDITVDDVFTQAVSLLS